METLEKTNGWSAFRNGLAHSIRHPQVLLFAYLVNLLTGLLLVIIPALSLVGPAHRTAIKDAANGIDAWLVEEIMGASTTYSVLQGVPAEPPPWLQQGLLIVLFTLLAIPLLAWLPSSFMGGGILLTFVEAPQPFSWRRFLWGSWHWFGAFLFINLMLGVVTSLLISALIAGIITAASTVGAWINWVTLSLSILIIVPWLAVVEYTRLFAITNNTRNIFQTFGGAFALIFRRPLALMGLYGLSLLLLAVIHLVFRGLLLKLHLDWWPLIFVVTQAFILARLWARMVRWTGALDIK